MNNFDNLFFRTYIGSDNDIKKVFHRHVFIILEDIILWVFFALCIPMFLYSQDIFSLQSSIPSIYVSLYMLFIYAILIYKLFDWYVDVWIMTESTIIDMRWRWFSANILYIPYDKIEGIQVRTRSWWAALLGMSDVETILQRARAGRSSIHTDVLIGSRLIAAGCETRENRRR